MKTFSRHSFAILAILFYVVGGALIEITHHHETKWLLESRPLLESHDCGANERHIPIQDARQCLACFYSTQRLSTELFTFHPFDVSCIGVAIFPIVDGQVLSTDILYSGKRGPPYA